MDNAADVAMRLEAVFRNIHQTRMNDVPILNPELRVEAVGFRAWNNDWLGVLVTPWFINLMLLPGNEECAGAWKRLGLGASAAHVFPAGRIEFIAGEEEDLGCFQMCSLFSPVLEFENQEAARAAGKAALEELLAEASDENAPEPDRHMMRMAKGDFPSAEEIAAERERATSHQLSRRSVITGTPGEKEKAAS